MREAFRRLDRIPDAALVAAEKRRARRAKKAAK
jgi:hypothetical protein